MTIFLRLPTCSRFVPFGIPARTTVIMQYKNGTLCRFTVLGDSSVTVLLQSIHHLYHGEN